MQGEVVYIENNETYDTLLVSKCLTCKYCGNIVEPMDALPDFSTSIEMHTKYDEKHCPQKEECRRYYESFILPLQNLESLPEEYVVKEKILPSEEILAKQALIAEVARNIELLTVRIF